MKLAGVVVLYNPDGKVLKNIKTYLNELEKLYIIDNSAVDNSKKFVNKKFKYISNGKNLGIAKALNIGASKAIDDDFKWLLTMDQDSSFPKGELEKMIRFINNLDNELLIEITKTTKDEIGLISPFHKTFDNENINNNRGIDYPETVMTSGNIINLNAYQKIGGYKDWLFIDCVDFDYCLNLKKHGFNVVRLKYVNLKHQLGNGFFKKILFKTFYTYNHNDIRRYYIVRNRNYICNMYKNDFPDYCKLEKSRTKRELLKVWLLEKDKILKTKAMLKGYRDYKNNIKGKIKD